MKRYNLKDTTFVIPFKLDSGDRVENIKLIVSYIFRNFDTNILIAEEGNKPSGKFLKDIGCKYNFTKNNHDYCNMAVMRNIGVRLCKTPIINIYDVDMILPEKGYVDAVSLLRKKSVDCVISHNGHCANIHTYERDKLKSRLESGIEFNKSIDGFELKTMILKGDCVAGSLFFNRKSFIFGGMENENLRCGRDDKERYMRFSKLGYDIRRTDNSLYHLNHPRLSNSLRSSNKKHNKNEFKRVSKMNSKELRKYVNGWGWIK